jgi:glyoxalase family protein
LQANGSEGSAVLNQIEGLHHVTAMAGSARANNAFFTDTLGLRRVKKTVNFDAPYVYHLYYGDERGTPGAVMTYFPFPHIARGHKGAGEVGGTVLAVPKGALGFWKDRLAARGVEGLAEGDAFGGKRLAFTGPDGDELALVEADDPRAPGPAAAFRPRRRSAASTAPRCGSVTRGRRPGCSASWAMTRPRGAAT